MPETTVTAPALHVVVNGAPLAIGHTATVADLVVQLALAGKRIAVELNGDIVPRSRHAATVLHDGDRLEVVAAVGGG